MPGALEAAGEIGRAAAAVDPRELEVLAREIAGARQLILHGAGREGLMMQALAMRLHHLGLSAHVWGDMSMPPAGQGDLVLLAAGPGDLPTVGVLAELARKEGARSACITAQPSGSTPGTCDLVLVIPAQTMADDQGVDASVLPMGSVFEGALFLVSEMLVLQLAVLLDQSPEDIRVRHANLE